MGRIEVQDECVKGMGMGEGQCIVMGPHSSIFLPCTLTCRDLNKSEAQISEGHRNFHASIFIITIIYFY